MRMLSTGIGHTLGLHHGGGEQAQPKASRQAGKDGDGVWRKDGTAVDNALPTAKVCAQSDLNGRFLPGAFTELVGKKERAL
jgi:hypothetical protein